MDNRIKELMELQKFEQNPRLKKIIDETAASAEDWGELPDSALLINAAGEQSFDCEKPEKEDADDEF